MEISIEIPSWLVSRLEIASTQCQATYVLAADIYMNTRDFLGHQNNLWWVLSSLVIFWPLWVYFAIAVTAASTWIFWLLASVIMGILQVIYVTYQFFMIAADVSVLTMLKTYQVLMRSRLINSIFFFSKRLRRSRQRTSRRRKWRKQCEMATTYNDFLKIQVVEPPAPQQDGANTDNAIGDTGAVGSRAGAVSGIAAARGINGKAQKPISILRRPNVTKIADDSALPPLQLSSSKSSPSLSTSSSWDDIDNPANASRNSSSSKTGSINRSSKGIDGVSNVDVKHGRAHTAEQPDTAASPFTRQHSFGTLRTLYENYESDLNDSGSPHRRTSSPSLSGAAHSLTFDAKRLGALRMKMERSSEDEIKDQIREELGNKPADLLPSTMARLKEARHAYTFDDGDDKSLEHLLSGVVKRNHLTLEDLLVENGRSIAESGQYRYSPASRKLMSAYQFEVSRGIDTLAEAPTKSADPLVELSNRMTLLRKMKQNMGRTALMLSGGGAQAMYHLGTVRALIDAGVYDEVKVISGTSGGSITAAMCAIKSSQELYEHVCVPTVSTNFMKTGRMKRENIRWFPPVKDMITYWFKHRLLVDSSEFRRTCEFYYSDITFEEAFERTGKHVCITVSASRASGNTLQRLLLNHISTPHVTLASAVAASCALPGVMAPAKLQAKSSNGTLEPFEVDGVEWIDGSVQADLPFQRISTMFNVSNYVVAQTNFHVRPFLRKEHHPSSRSLYWAIFQTLEWDIRSRALKLSRLGLFPRVFGQDVSKVFKQKYHGNLTLVPRFTAMQTFGMKALVNPTARDMEGYLKFGQIAAWPYLSVMREMMRLETALDFSLNRLKERCGELYPDLGDLDNTDFNDDFDTVGSGGTGWHSFASPLVREGHSKRIHLKHSTNSSDGNMPTSTSSSLTGGAVGGHPHPSHHQQQLPRLVRFSSRNREAEISDHQKQSLRAKVVHLECENSDLRQELERMKRMMQQQEQQQIQGGMVTDAKTARADDGPSDEAAVLDGKANIADAISEGEVKVEDFEPQETEHSSEEELEALQVVKRLSLMNG